MFSFKLRKYVYCIRFFVHYNFFNLCFNYIWKHIDSVFCFLLLLFISLCFNCSWTNIYVLFYFLLDMFISICFNWWWRKGVHILCYIFYGLIYFIQFYILLDWYVFCNLLFIGSEFYWISVLLDTLFYWITFFIGFLLFFLVAIIFLVRKFFCFSSLLRNTLL